MKLDSQYNIYIMNIYIQLINKVNKNINNIDISIYNTICIYNIILR